MCPRCNKYVDAYLEHTFSCKKIGRNSVHHPIVKTAYFTFNKLYKKSATGVYYEMKPERIQKPDVKEDIRCDVVLMNPVTDSEKYIDFTFPKIKTNAVQKTSSVHWATDRKYNWWKERCNFDNNIRFIPAVIDSLGRMGDELKSLLEDVARETSVGEWEYSMNVSHLRSTISIQHARTIARAQINYIKSIAFTDN